MRRQRAAALADSCARFLACTCSHCTHCRRRSPEGRRLAERRRLPEQQAAEQRGQQARHRQAVQAAQVALPRQPPCTVAAGPRQSSSVHATRYASPATLWKQRARHTARAIHPHLPSRLLAWPLPQKWSRRAAPPRCSWASRRAGGAGRTRRGRRGRKRPAPRPCCRRCKR